MEPLSQALMLLGVFSAFKLATGGLEDVQVGLERIGSFIVWVKQWWRGL